MKTIYNYSILLALVLTLFAACKKGDYIDTGIHEAKYKGTVWNYLESRPDLFDTLMVALKVAKLDETLKNDEVTFFAPADPCILRAVWLLNESLFRSGQDSITKLEQIRPEVWRKYLSRYIFKGKNVAKDYRQLDTLNMAAYSGGIYQTIAGEDMNVGVLYNDVKTKDETSGTEQIIKYAGYRQLYINFPFRIVIPGLEDLYILPYITAPVATSDIQPTNGVLHVLQFSKHTFGFHPFQFASEAYNTGVLPRK